MTVLLGRDSRKKFHHEEVDTGNQCCGRWLGYFIGIRDAGLGGDDGDVGHANVHRDWYLCGGSRTKPYGQRQYVGGGYPNAKRD